MSHKRLILFSLVVLTLLVLSLHRPSSSSASTVVQSAITPDEQTASTPPITQLSMSGEPGDYIGGTASYFYTPATGTFNATSSDHSGDGVVDYVQINYTDNNHWWYLEFSTEHVPGKNLLPGFYTDAQRAPFADNGHPGLNVFGDGRGCNTLQGSFTVHEANFDYSFVPARLLNFTASFEQHCEGGAPALLGTVYYNYTGAASVTYSIGGKVTDIFGAGVPNLPVVLSGSQTANGMTDSSGNYSFTQLLGSGNYRVTPTAVAGYIVSPTTQSVKRLLSDQTVNFSAVPLFNISGQILNGSGSPITGVNVSLTGSQTGFTSTDNNGNYSFSGLRADGNYVVTPNRTNYGFTPPSRSFNTLSGNTTANFTGNLLTYTIGGRVIDAFGIGIAQVAVNLSGSQASTTQTDSNGNYSFTNLTAGGFYIVTPSKVNYSFAPASQSFSNLSGNFGSINFTGTLKSYTIGGVVLDGSGNSLSGVLVALSGSQSGSTVTDNNGSFSFIVQAGGDYAVTPSSSTYIFSPGNRTFLNLSSNQAANFVGTAQSIQFSAAAYVVGEGNQRVEITVTRLGNTAGAASIGYLTVDDQAEIRCDTINGKAYARCDYGTSLDTLNFAAGEVSKTFTIPIIDDSFAEGNETFTVGLVDPSGATLGAITTATVTINDNDTVNGANPIFNTPFFVREQYLDFLSREPEAGEPWSNVLNGCSDLENNPACDRTTVSAAFFGSQEFQLKGYYVFRFYKLAFNRLPLYPEIVADMRAVTGQTPAEVFQKKAMFANRFVQGAEFANTYGGMTNVQYVATLLGRYSLTQVTTPDPAAPDGPAKVTLTAADLTNLLTSGTMARGQVLRAIADSDQVFSLEFNRAFVAMQYYGYLRRTPEVTGYNSWLDYLNAHPTDSRTMVNGFMNSTEYRLRFGPSQ